MLDKQNITCVFENFIRMPNCSEGEAPRAKRKKRSYARRSVDSDEVVKAKRRRTEGQLKVCRDLANVRFHPKKRYLVSI